MNKEKACDGVSNFIDALLMQDNSFRDDHITDTIKDIIVDTVCAPDTGKWETGIYINGKWIIVSQYDDKDSAIKGHKQYVKSVKKGKRHFKDIDLWGLNE